jgi:hypothetical protein
MWIAMKRILSYSLVVLISIVSYNIWAYTPEDCNKCHGEGSSGSMLHISLSEFKDSIHSRSGIICQDCHTDVIDEDHQRVKGSGSVDCSQCHDQENRHGLKSEKEKRPQCYSCHTKHNILEKDSELSTVHPKQLKETCKACHPAECGETNYLSWFPSIQVASHSKQDFSRAYEKDNCLGCHQGMAAHGEEGLLNNQNCHICHLPLKGRASLRGYIHPKADHKKQPSVFAAAIVYQLVILILLWGGFKFYIRKLSQKTGKPGR